jgi:hypothetical protein
MENEEFFAAEPEVDALVRARERSEVTETSRLLPASDEASHEQPYYLTDTRPQWRRPSVSDDRELKVKESNHLTRHRYGGCSHLECCSRWASADLPSQRLI